MLGNYAGGLRERRGPNAACVVLVIVVAVLSAILASGVRVLKRHERAVLSHLGKVCDGARGPRA